MCTLLACVLLTQRLIFTEHDSGCFSPFFKKRNFLVKYGTHVSRVSRKGSGFNRHLALITEPGVSPSVIKKSNRRSVLCSAVAVARLNIGHTLRKFPDSVSSSEASQPPPASSHIKQYILYTISSILASTSANFFKIFKNKFQQIPRCYFMQIAQCVGFCSIRSEGSRHKNFSVKSAEFSYRLCTFSKRYDIILVYVSIY